MSVLLQPFPASAVLRDATPQTGPAAAGTAADDVRRGQFAALLTDALARSRPLTAHAHKATVQEHETPEPRERRTDAETRAGRRDQEPDPSDRTVSEADDPAVDEQESIAPTVAASPPVIEAIAPVVPPSPAPFSPPPDRALMDGAPGASGPVGAPVMVKPTAAGPVAAATAANPALSPEQPNPAGDAEGSQPSQRAGGRSVRESQTPLTERPAAQPTVAVGRPDGNPAPEPANFTRAIMAAVGTPVRLSVVSDTAPGVMAAGMQQAATAPAQGPAQGTAHPSAEAIGPTGQSAQAIVLPQEGPPAPSPTQPARTDTLAVGAPAALVTAAAAADLAAGGDETQGFAFRDGAVSGRLAVTGKAGARSSIALKSTPDQVAVHITRAAQSGTNRIEIRLDPESLGHVEVTLEVGRDGRVSALVLTENREALDALKAEARALQQALQDAGLKSDADSLSFDMRSEYGRRGATSAFVPEDRAGRPPADVAGQGELQSPLQRRGAHRSANARGQLDVLA